MERSISGRGCYAGAAEKESGVPAPPPSPALFLSSLAKEPNESQDSTGAGSVPSSVMTRDLAAMLLAPFSFLRSCLLCMGRQAGKNRQTAKTPEHTQTDTYPDTQTPRRQADTDRDSHIAKHTNTQDNQHTDASKQYTDTRTDP